MKGPYADQAVNEIYELLFCDHPENYRQSIQPPRRYPWDVILSDAPNQQDLNKVIMDTMVESRIRLVACHILKQHNLVPPERILLGVIVEIGMDGGLDVLAAYRDGSARYINYTSRLLIWEASDLHSALLTKKIFDESERIVEKIGPWNKPRKLFPATGELRISFLMSDGLYFGEGPVNILFKDPMAGPALNAATEMLQYITEKVK
jgi:hypothetical protein